MNRWIWGSSVHWLDSGRDLSSRHGRRSGSNSISGRERMDGEKTDRVIEDVLKDVRSRSSAIARSDVRHKCDKA